MKYACVVHHDEAKLAAMPSAELEALVQECFDWIAELEKAGRHVLTAGLQCRRTAVTLRGTPGKVTMTEGPFAETKESLGGIVVLALLDLNDAVTLLSKHPALPFGVVMEIRPIDEEMAGRLEAKLERLKRN